MTRTSALTALFLAASTSLAAAEFEFSAYGGWQTAPHSLVEVSGVGATSFTAGWEGRSFRMPPYWGVRGTWWIEQMPGWGVALDYQHAKVYADAETFTNDIPTWSRFEFSDGLNILTVNAMYRFQQFGKWRPYLGAGVGISVPHVEVTRPSGTTFEYQLGGAAFTGLAGVNYRITDRWSVFGEYKFNYTMNEVDIDSGSKLKTNIINNAFVAGVSIHF